MEVKISKGPESIMVDEKEEYVRKIDVLNLFDTLKED